MNIMPAVLDRSAVITQHTYNGETLGKRIADLPRGFCRSDEGSVNLSGYHHPAFSAGYIRSSGSAGIFMPFGALFFCPLSILIPVMVLKTKKYAFGFIIGLINALFGAGGGMIAVPFLKKCGLSQKQAQATAICVILPLTVLSAAIYLLRGYFRLSDAVPFILFGFPGTLVGTVLLSKMKNSLLQSVFSLFMLWAGFRLVVG